MADQGQRRGGTISLKINGEILDAKGSFTYKLGHPVRTPIQGADGMHGYTEKPSEASIEGEITDRGNLSLSDLARFKNGTAELALANGKVIGLNNAYFAGDLEGQTEEGNVKVKFVGDSPAVERMA